MSTAKRSRQRQSEVGPATSLPPTKKARTSKDAAPGLSFLTDERQRAGKKLNANITVGAKDQVRSRPDDSNVVVTDHADVHHEVDMEDAEMSVDGRNTSDESSTDDDEESEAEDRNANGGLVHAGGNALTNGVSDHGDGDAPPAGEVSPHEDAGDAGEPSFADMLQARHPDAIDVQAAFGDKDQISKALVPAENARMLQAPSATSLGTVLTQALRTNDKDLLESCLQMRDTASIRSTIQRLQSPLVATLLQRLAERLHKRPGRAGPLMVWIQWSLVAHGGYLASQPQVMRKLKSLSQVVRERANSLQSLMMLKGKLDMLSAQIELRRSIQASRPAHAESDDDEDGVIYVEGEEDESSSDEATDVAAPKVKQPNHLKRMASEAKASEDENVTMVNGLVNGAADESSENEEEEDEETNLLDDEAEETSDDEGEDLSEDEVSELEDDEDSAEEGDLSASDEEEAPSTKQPTRSSHLSRANR